MDNLVLSVSHTTRARRPGELGGVDYHFVDTNAFETSVANAGYLEYAQVFDNYYGTSRRKTESLMQVGKDVVLEIDWQGARQVREAMPATPLSVFIIPPSLEALEQRLRGRGQDSDQVIARRMLDAKEQIKHYDEYDYLVVNDDFDVALNELSSIFKASHLSASVQSERQQALLRNLLA
jgi:guanylate kinase